MTHDVGQAETGRGQGKGASGAGEMGVEELRGCDRIRLGVETQRLKPSLRGGSDGSRHQ